MGVHLRLPAAAVGSAAARRGCSGRSCCRGPSTVPRYDSIKQIGPAALRALGVQTAFTHMEWFARPDGSVAVSEVGARPPGAQLASMIGFSHDDRLLLDVGRAGAARRPSTHPTGCTPPVRPTSADRVAAGSARCTAWTRCNARLGHLVVDAKLPRPGQPASTSYEGEGFVTVRHEDTAVVRAALDRIISELRVELVEAE